MDELTPLSLETLGQLPSTVRTPSYRRGDLSAGLVHIGVGNFHRAHQAWYLHRLFDAGDGHDWAILGAGVRSFDAKQRDTLLAQDCLTTLIELGPGGQSAEVSGSMVGYVPLASGNGPLIAAMSDPAIRIVSLTVTEGGYYQDGDGGFDAAHPDIAHDAAHPHMPMTAFGAMIAALKSRREAGLGPFTGLSCDNVQGNGDVLRRTVVGLAKMSDPDLAAWIDQTCSFPNSMVDCIVPATGPKEREAVKDFGIADAAPVTHENFRQWVIEDDFCADRPALEQVGVTFTDNVHAYEELKLRILNAGHQIIAVPGELLGIETIEGCMEDDDLSALLSAVIEREVLPNLSAVPDYTPQEYLAMVRSRFANPGIRDTTRRVAFDGSSRQTGFVMPSARAALEAGTPYSGLALMAAIWARYCRGTTMEGKAIEPNDPHWDKLHAAALAATKDPANWLDQPGVFADLAEADGYREAFASWLTRIDAEGLRPAIRAYLES